jgi:hypothetical protein
MWESLQEKTPNARSSAYLDAVVVKEHPVFRMLYAIWVCPSCKVRSSTDRFADTARWFPTGIKMQRAMCTACGMGSNPNRSRQIELGKSGFARLDSATAQRKRHRAAVNAAASDVRMAEKLAAPVHGFANFSLFKCSVSAILAWLYKSPARSFFLDSAKSSSLTEALAAWTDSSTAAGATAAHVSHSMVQNMWKCLKLPDVHQDIHDVFLKLLREAPGLAAALTFTTREICFKEPRCHCGSGSEKSTPKEHIGDAYLVMAVDFTQDSVSTLDLLAAVKTDRKQNCESCHKLRTVFFEESVDLTTCKELFAAVLRRDRFAKPKNTKKNEGGTGWSTQEGASVYTMFRTDGQQWPCVYVASCIRLQKRDRRRRPLPRLHHAPGRTVLWRQRSEVQ